jgi:hypothetical protein
MSQMVLAGRFPKIGVSPNHPKLYYFSIETYGFGGAPF